MLCRTTAWQSYVPSPLSHRCCPGGSRRHLDTVNILWYIVLASVGAAALWLKSETNKKSARIILLILMTLFVSSKYYQSIFVEKRLSKSGPSIDVDRAEIMLRLSSAVNMLRVRATQGVQSIPGGQSLPGGPVKLVASADKMDTFAEARTVLKNAAEAEPESAGAWAKLLVVQHESKSPRAEIETTLAHLQTIKTPVGAELAKTMHDLFEGQIQGAAEEAAVKNVIVHQLPTGWYQEHALQALYKKAKDKVELQALNDSMLPRQMTLIAKMLFLVAFGAVSLLVGIIIIFVQLLFVARKNKAVDESALVKAPVSSGIATIYGVFIGWLTTQQIIGSLAQNALKSISPYLKMSSGMETDPNKPLLIGLTVAALYILSNAPGTIYAYLFAMRPSQISFLEGFRIRTRVGKNGPFKLVLAGVATWFVAVPLVLLATFIGAKLFGSQGSTNPIIALVMEAARSGNWLSTIVFYLTLGVLAPLCEETLFRGFLYANLRRKLGVFPSVLISAGLFAACHLDVGAFLPLFTLGSLFALVFEKQKSILPSMVAHGLWNSGTFTLILLLFG